MGTPGGERGETGLLGLGGVTEQPAGSLGQGAPKGKQ